MIDWPTGLGIVLSGFGIILLTVDHLEEPVLSVLLGLCAIGTLGCGVLVFRRAV